MAALEVAAQNEHAEPKRESKAQTERLADNKWEQVQIQVFTGWINEYLSTASLEVEDVVKDLDDGIRLPNFVEMVTDKRIRTRWNKKPRNNMQRRENLTIALEHIDKEVRLAGVGSADFEEHVKKMILGFLWTVYKEFRLNRALKEHGNKGNTMEEGLLNWVRSTTEGYDGVEVKDFRHSFRNGLAFLALADKYVGDSEKIDYSTFDAENSTENLQRAFEVANQEMQIPMLLDASEVADGDVDERTIVLYTSLFFHKFLAKEQEGETEEERRRQEERLAALNAESDAKARSAADLQKENEELRARVEAQDAELQRLRDELADRKAHEEELEGNVEMLEGKVEVFEGEKTEMEARVARELKGLALLKEQLTQHITELHRWEGLLMPGGTIGDVSVEGEVRADALAEISEKDFDDQLADLAERLTNENEQLQDKLAQAEAEQKATAPKDKKKGGAAADAKAEASGDDGDDDDADADKAAKKKSSSSRKGKSSKKH